jgi:hypothetical protein
MTWFEERIQSRPADEEKIKLLNERDKLEKQLKQLNSTVMGKSEAAMKGRKEDLLAIAKKMVTIDRKLGRA